MEIKSLENINIDIIYKAFHEAFYDYEMQLDQKQFESMLNRRGFNPKISFAAFEDNKIVAFTLNGVGNFNQQCTAYDTGTGTLKEYRGRGLASRVFEYSIPHLQQMGITQYLLEVLQHNTKAVSVYKNLGFQVVREFNYFRQEVSKLIDLEITKSTDSFYIKQMDIKEFINNNTSICNSSFEDFYPSWQNSLESIQRSLNDFLCLVAYSNTSDKIVGYCIFEPQSGDITMLAVEKENRRKGIASKLLKETIPLLKINTIKVINTDTTASSITKFLESKNINITGKQYEMIKKI